ncbi:hypothetical protein ACFE04_006267 [Oxalis oulophora]
MEKLTVMRSVYRSIFRRSSRFAIPVAQQQSRTIFTTSSPSSSLDRFTSDSRSPLTMSLGPVRYFSQDITHVPTIKDRQILDAFNDLMAANWNHIPPAVLHDVLAAVNKTTDDKDGQEVLKNVLRAAEACEEFGGILKSLKMELDDSIGVTGEDSKPLSDELAHALEAVFARYMVYLALFKPEETYLRKKVENELGSAMIHLKMRCGGLHSSWGGISVLGTSGLSGSYVEKRAK